MQVLFEVFIQVEGGGKVALVGVGVCARVGYFSVVEFDDHLSDLEPRQPSLLFLKVLSCLRD